MDDVRVHPLDILQVDVGTTFEDLSVEFDSDFENAGASYSMLRDKPKIEGRTLVGDKTFAELGLLEMTNLEFLQMYNDIVRS